MVRRGGRWAAVKVGVCQLVFDPLCRLAGRGGDDDSAVSVGREGGTGGGGVVRGSMTTMSFASCNSFELKGWTVEKQPPHLPTPV